MGSARHALLSLLVSGCGASSPYDPAWVGAQVGASAGQTVPDRSMAEGAKAAHDFSPSVPPGVTLGSMTEGDAVRVALWNSATFRADVGQLGFTRADLADAAVLPNPNLSFLFPIGPRQLELSAQYPVSMLIQRPYRIAAAKLDVERIARGLVQNGLDFVRDVRVAWAELLAADQRQSIRERIDAIMQRSAALAATRLANGDVSALEADLVRVESLSAHELARRSVHERNVVRARLRLLVGLAQMPAASAIGAASGDSLDDAAPDVADAERTALASRPDLRAAEIALEGAAERASLEKAKILQLFARLDAKPVGTRGGPPLLWLPGFTADIPIFNQNPGGRARARAELERGAWQYVATRQQVMTDVRVAH